MSLRARPTALPGILLILLAATVAPATARAQSSCSSDGQPRPVALVERFISADCERCWSDASTPRPKPRELAIDWIVPGRQGADAPLSAAANTDAAVRLRALRQAAPVESMQQSTPLMAAARTLRVAHGLPFNDYVGASIELKPAGRAPWTAWLLLVETVPAGTEGSPVERNLVRNVFQPAWDKRRPRSTQELDKLFESRPMRIPEGTNPDRLRVVGWVEDALGRIRAISESRCVPTGGER